MPSIASPPAPAPSEGSVGAALRRAGLWLLALAALLPYEGCSMSPSKVESDQLGWFDPSPVEGYIPMGRFEEWVRDEILDLKGSGQETFFPKGGSADDPGAIVLVAAPVWALALWAARRPGRRFRRTADLVLHGGMAILLVLFVRQIARRPEGEAIAVLAGALLLLAARPRGRWGLGDVEATVSTQAVVALGLVFLHPSACYWEWVYDEGRSPGLALLALRHKYRIGFPAAAAGLALVAAPLYLDRGRVQRLYDALDLWRSRWWTRTPTSTSTGSTPTGTPSSTGPGPPGSSPS